MLTLTLLTLFSSTLALPSLHKRACTHGEWRCKTPADPVAPFGEGIDICDVGGQWTHDWSCEPNQHCGYVSGITAYPFCLDNGGVPTCTDGDTRCTDDNVEVCAGNAWITQEACISPEQCVTVSATVAECQTTGGTCTYGEYRCNAALDGIDVCQWDGTWVHNGYCAATEHCDYPGGVPHCVV